MPRQPHDHSPAATPARDAGPEATSQSSGQSSDRSSGQSSDKSSGEPAGGPPSGSVRASRERARSERDDGDFLRDSASALVAQTRAGTLCPVALVEATLERIAAVNPTVNAICTVADDAVAQAQALRDAVARGTAPGPLYGLPVGIKDVTDTAGLKTTYASELFADHVPETDALVVARLRAAGAVIIGKTNTPEMAVGVHTDNALFGPTRNPWHLERTVGGSTGGGAAALACGMAALADGTDVGGSLRVPAAYCGVVGLRPSPGLVPKWPSVDPWDTIEAMGPMARTVADVALMLQVLAGPSPMVPVSRPITGRDFVAAAARPLDPGLRVGFVADLSGRGIDPELAALARQAGQRLVEASVSAGRPAELEELALDLSAGHEAFLAIRGAWMVTQHLGLLDELERDGGALGKNLSGNLRDGLRGTPRQIAAARRTRAELAARLQAVFDQVDVLITPTVAVPPFRIEDGPPMTIGGQPMQSYIDWVAPTYLLTLTSAPVLALPCGLDADGIPAGLQLVGPIGSEERLLTVGAALEAALRPTLPPLAALLPEATPGNAAMEGSEAAMERNQD